MFVFFGNGGIPLLLQCLRQHGQWLAVLDVTDLFVSFYMFILKANKKQ